MTSDDVPESRPALVRRSAGLAVCMASASLGTSAANVALPQIADAFGGGFARAQWVVVAYLLGMTAASVTVGYLGDVFDRAGLLAAGAGLFAAAALACALAPSYGVLLVARAVQGAAAAVLMTLPLAIARDTTCDHRVGSMMGLLGSTFAVGTAAGPVLGGFAIAQWEWRAAFAAMAPFALAALVLGARGRRGPAPNHQARRSRSAASRGRPRIDGVGVSILTATVVLYAVAATVVDRHAPARVTIALLAGVVAGVIALGLVERRAAHPVLPPTLVRDRTVGTAMVANLVVGAVMMTTLVVGPFYLSGALGLGPATIGLAMSAGPITSIVAGVVSGRFADRYGPGRMVRVGLAVMVAGALLLSWLPAGLGLAGYVAGIVALAPGYQLFLAANNTQVMTAVVPHRRGSASGLLGLSRNLGLVTGTTAMGALFATAAGASPAIASPGNLASALTVTFLAAAAALGVSLAIGLAAGRNPPSGPPASARSGQAGASKRTRIDRGASTRGDPWGPGATGYRSWTSRRCAARTTVTARAES